MDLYGSFSVKLALNFAGQPNVRAVQGDGTKIDFDPADVIYVNASATRPVDLWLDRLKDGGRLILPLTTDKESRGAVFRIERRGGEYRAKWIAAGDTFPAKARATPSLSERSLRRSRRAAGTE